MIRAALLVPLTAMIAAACWGGEAPPEPPEPEPMVRVDTVVITREVSPPVPEGRATMLCLASGQNAEIRVSPAGDTLVGPQRVRLTDLGPAIGFVGNYAGDESWFTQDQPLTLNRRAFSKFGQPESRDCRGMKIVADFNGVNVFSDVAASEPFRILYVPVRPGVFQSYQAQVGRVRG
jgi:hypothetical protein